MCIHICGHLHTCALTNAKCICSTRDVYICTNTCICACSCMFVHIELSHAWSYMNICTCTAHMTCVWYIPARSHIPIPNSTSWMLAASLSLLSSLDLYVRLCSRVCIIALFCFINRKKELRNYLHNCCLSWVVVSQTEIFSCVLFLPFSSSLCSFLASFDHTILLNELALHKALGSI